MKHRQTAVNKVGLINSDGHSIGIDIGATAVRAAILAPGTQGGRPSVTIHGSGQIELPFGAVSGGVVVDKAAVTAAIKQLWQQNRFECRNVIVGFSNQQVVVREFEMPNLSPEQQRKALPFQAREIVALPMDQALLDFAPLQEPDPTTGTVTGLLIAAPRQPILAAVEAVEAAGLRVARVDLSSLAVLRSIAEEHLSVEAVVDLGAQLTSIVVHNQGIPKVVRTISRGGQELTDRLTDRLSLNPNDAETAKRMIGLLGDTEPAVNLRDAVRPLLAEIRSSVNFFSSTNPGALLERVSLTGGGSSLPGLADALSSLLGVPTSVVEATQHIRNRWATRQGPDDGGEFSATAVSVGLAMGAAA